MKRRWTAEDMTPQICVAAVIRNGENQEILIQKHRKLRKWTVPMGKCKPGQSTSAAIKRELMEECGIKVTKMMLTAKDTFIGVRDKLRMEIPIYLYEIQQYTGKVKNLEPRKHPVQKFMDPRKLREEKKPLTRALWLYMVTWYGKHNLL